MRYKSVLITEILKRRVLAVIGVGAPGAWFLSVVTPHKAIGVVSATVLLAHNFAMCFGTCSRKRAEILEKKGW